MIVNQVVEYRNITAKNPLAAIELKYTIITVLLALYICISSLSVNSRPRLIENNRL